MSKKKEKIAGAVVASLAQVSMTGIGGNQEFTFEGTTKIRFLDGGDVALVVNDSQVSFEDGIILRWGRKRG